MSDAPRLQQYVDAWAEAVDATVALLRELEETDWQKPTDLPGWDVRAVACHLAHLESELAGNEQARVEVPELEHVVSPMGRYTEMGPIARRDWSTDQIVDELASSAATRLADLRANPPADGTASPPRTPGGIGWDWEGLLSNRAFDVWMHEQDIRRAVGRPGGLDSPAAAHTVKVFTRSFGYVVGKRVAPPAGTRAGLEVTGEWPARIDVRVDEDGRAVPDASGGDPDVLLTMNVESYIRLCGGRRPAGDLDIKVDGDEGLGQRILDSMAVTP
jgi:uncharacterized protein (TIGR03083 family)